MLRLGRRAGLAAAAPAAAALGAGPAAALELWQPRPEPAAQQQPRQQRRRYVDGKVGADADDVAALLESAIRRPSREEARAAREARAAAPPRLLTTRREALSLYREVLRYSRLFVWRDEHGRRWRDVLRASARAEFEAARREPDPEIINRLIVTGRDAVARAVEGVMRRRAAIIEEEAAAPRAPPM
ncbi:hypothetical protein HT031_004954 [Scenedesmus sp. PABB004]|nr:hypothetical protein HT031_004954 [Scenedesmus sp. PABB004]